jgi:hypothetical protein
MVVRDAAASMSVAAPCHLGPQGHTDGAPPHARAMEPSADLGGCRRGQGADTSGEICVLRASAGEARARAAVTVAEAPGPTLSTNGMDNAVRSHALRGSWMRGLRLSAHAPARIDCRPASAGASSREGEGGGGG